MCWHTYERGWLFWQLRKGLATLAQLHVLCRERLPWGQLKPSSVTIHVDSHEAVIENISFLSNIKLIENCFVLQVTDWRHTYLHLSYHILMGFQINGTKYVRLQSHQWLQHHRHFTLLVVFILFFLIFFLLTTEFLLPWMYIIFSSNQ